MVTICTTTGVVPFRGAVRNPCFLSLLEKYAPPRHDRYNTSIRRVVTVWMKQVDTNILNVDMAALSDEAPYATGDPTVCSGCQACLSAVSILAPVSAADNDGGSSDGV